jgi:Domain of unknown function (DUF1844)
MAEEEKPIRVVDRRMFTPEGDLRTDVEAEEAPEPAKAEPPPPPPRRDPSPDPAAPPGEAGPAPGDESGFLGIVRSLATTAYAALGLVPEPATGARRREPAVARQMIDWLGVLEQKTRGNLTFEESDLLSRVLYELRMAFVEVMRPPGREPQL